MCVCLSVWYLSYPPYFQFPTEFSLQVTALLGMECDIRLLNRVSCVCVCVCVCVTAEGSEYEVDRGVGGGGG